MEPEIEKSVFNELSSLKQRVEESERTLATLMEVVRKNSEAIKLILTAAKIAHDKETQNAPKP